MQLNTQFKTSLIAGGVALALANGAHAGALGAANEIFIGGATAPQNFLREDIMFRICDGTPQVFVDDVAVTPDKTFTPGSGSNILNQGDHFVVRCTTKSTFANANLNTKDVAFYKFNGGSATGVAPVADPDGAAAGDMQYLDASVAGCAAFVSGDSPSDADADPDNLFPVLDSGRFYELYECTNPALVKTQMPDAGVSDVEPGLFVGPLALSFGTEPRGVTQRPTQPFSNPTIDAAGIETTILPRIKPGPGLLYGTVVTLPMYDELIDDQLAAGRLPDCPASPTRAQRDSLDCMPSLPAAAVKSLFAGDITSWAQFQPYGETLDPARVEDAGDNIANDGNDVHLCKRVNGSGTHAQHSVHYLGTNCRRPNNVSMIPQNDGLASAAFGIVGMYSNQGSSDMSDCVDALGNGQGFDGDFDGLPPESFADTGDSVVVPGTALAAIAIPGDPFGRSYNTPVTAYGAGYQSLEKNTSLSFDYRFVKENDVAPTLENAINGDYNHVYYLSFQDRVVAATGEPNPRPYAAEPDPAKNQIRSSEATGGQKDVMAAYFEVWNNIDPAAIQPVNDGLVVDPDGTLGNGDEWGGGYVTASATAAFTFDGTNPNTRWSRQGGGGEADSCQDLQFFKP